MSGVTAVLVHGAGHTSAVWRETQAALSHPSVAVDLPGRGTRLADVTTVTIAEAADSIVADVVADVDGDGDVVLVGHSVAATVLPAVAARLAGRVRHLVFVAGIAAPDGERPLDVFLPGQADTVSARLTELRERCAGRTVEALDARTALAIDSLNFSSQPMSWAGVPRTLPRTFIRCLQDPIQPPELQDRFIANCGAGTVLDIGSGHTPALDAPVALAVLLDGIIETAAASRTGTDPALDRPPSPTPAADVGAVPEAAGAADSGHVDQTGRDGGGRRGHLGVRE